MLDIGLVGVFIALCLDLYYQIQVCLKNFEKN